MTTIAYSVVVLAGGASRRMGRNKAFVRHHGKELIRYAIDLGLQLEAPLAISGPIVDYQHLGYPVLEDVVTDQGPLGGLYSLFDQLPSDALILIPCDCPDLRPETLLALIRKFQPPATVARDPEQIHPLVGIYHRSCLPFVEMALTSGRRSMHGLLDALDAHTLEFEDAEQFRNINYPDQIEP